MPLEDIHAYVCRSDIFDGVKNIKGALPYYSQSVKFWIFLMVS
jgi:hypothetical protein